MIWFKPAMRRRSCCSTILPVRSRSITRLFDFSSASTCTVNNSDAGFGKAEMFPEVVAVADERQLMATAIFRLELLPQPLPALTLTVPPFAPKLTRMEFVPAPDAMVAPDGTTQLYVVAPDTEAVEKATLV